ncbi:unnamed protein product [Fusarium graminearum]|nr:unnamed protein product [Fusarium graminearum]CAG1969659.1 unnamed protein product [Fusarium graminearum]CAG2001759.1 unnamed protein product [Fusarium graminearum]
MPKTATRKGSKGRHEPYDAGSPPRHDVGGSASGGETSTRPVSANKNFHMAKDARTQGVTKTQDSQIQIHHLTAPRQEPTHGYRGYLYLPQ